MGVAPHPTPRRGGRRGRGGRAGTGAGREGGRGTHCWEERFPPPPPPSSPPSRDRPGLSTGADIARAAFASLFSFTEEGRRPAAACSVRFPTAVRGGGRCIDGVQGRRGGAVACPRAGWRHLSFSPPAATPTLLCGWWPCLSSTLASQKLPLPPAPRRAGPGAGGNMADGKRMGMASMRLRAEVSGRAARHSAPRARPGGRGHLPREGVPGPRGGGRGRGGWPMRPGGRRGEAGSGAADRGTPRCSPGRSPWGARAA